MNTSELYLRCVSRGTFFFECADWFVFSTCAGMETGLCLDFFAVGASCELFPSSAGRIFVNAAFKSWCSSVLGVNSSGTSASSISSRSARATLRLNICVLASAEASAHASALIILETLLDASLRQAGDGEIVKRGIIPRVDGQRQSQVFIARRQRSLAPIEHGHIRQRLHVCGIQLKRGEIIRTGAKEISAPEGDVPEFYVRRRVFRVNLQRVVKVIL